MTEEEFQRNFPPDTSLPEMLKQLLRFQNREKSWYSGHFQLEKWPFGVAHWFGGDRRAAEQFVIFGREPDGSLYGLWLYPGRTIEDAPVVFLGSEGTDCGVLAGSFEKFMSLLAIGADELGFAVSWGRLFEQELPATRLKEFRQWLKASFGISIPQEPMLLVLQARSEHPDFSAWLSAWQASRA